MDSNRKGSKKTLNDWNKLADKEDTEGKRINQRKNITYEEVRKHSDANDCWIVINGCVFDVTDFMAYHPGGEDIIKKYAGKDATKAFFDAHSYVHVQNLLRNRLIGFTPKRT